jgi:tetratricopeptide (TPR) repeat protein
VKTLIIIFTSLICASQFAYSKSDSDCLGMQNDVTLMIQVRDYSSMLKATDWFIKNCKEYIEKYSNVPHLSDVEDYFNFYANKSEAYLGLGRYEDALKTSQECIDKSYRTVDCHLTKWRSLMELGRYEDAKAYKKTLYFMIQNKVDLLNQVNISSQRKELQPSLIEARRAKINKLKAYKGFLDRSD